MRPSAPPGAVKELSRRLSVPPLLASVLWARGLGAEAASYLNPPLDLSRIPDLPLAAERLEHALKHKKRIMIHGDYDADGISGTAVLTLGLRALGGNVIPFLPNRLTDGYGVHPERVAEHAERCELFITVDCGISNLAEVEQLQAAGVEVIVSDHHQPGQVKPNCLTVHPKLSPLARKGLPELTGAGVAYHLLWALHERLGLEAPLDYSDLASIGTIADVAPLLGENRALIQAGLRHMARSKWPGLRAAIAQTRIRGEPTARDVAFVLAPRLNAAGRLGEADLGLELLMTASERRARELAVYLDARNAERRKLQDEMFQQALGRVDPDAPALVLDDNSWHPGIMGIVASKLLERYYKPVFIIAKGKGSVRSTPGISAVAGLHHASSHLRRFGGHSQAAGFAIRDRDISAFRDAVYSYTRQHPAPRRTVLADAILSTEDVDKDFYRAICSLEPYGEGHPSPQFALTDKLEAARAVGQSKTTLQLRVAGLKGVAWQKGDLAAQLRPGSAVNAVISLRENEWQGKRSLEFLAEEVRYAEPLGLAVSVSAEQRIFRGPAPAGSRALSSAEDAGLEPTAARHLRTVPLGDTLLSASAPLHHLVASGATLYFGLDAEALRRLETYLLSYPSVQDVRRGFVCAQRGQRLPFDDVKAELVKTCLLELNLISDTGRPLRGQKRDPYSSDTLLSALTEHYKLSSFLKAYRYLDEPAFAASCQTLFGPEDSADSDACSE